MVLTFWQKLKLRLFGAAYLEHRTRPGWSGSLPFYAVKCLEHGVFEDYPHGYDEYFSCPQCLEEKYGKATPPDLVETDVEEVLHG